MTDGVSEKGKPYSSEFLSVSFCYYLKLIIFMCRINTRIDDRPVFRWCGVILDLYDTSVSSGSFLFVYISKESYLCVEQMPG